MNRRQLLKGLAVIPVASALNSCRKEEPEPHHEPSMHTVEVHLDGAFALVIQKNKDNSILAFSPKDPHEPHTAYFYGSANPKELEPTKSYHFTLSEEGLEKAKKTEIKPGFEDFFAEHVDFRPADNLITLELPSPESISFSGHREFVTFASPPDGSRTGWMPVNHILKYRAKDASHAKFLCAQFGEPCSASSDSPPGIARFFFEVGPPRSNNEQQNAEHAKNLFNDMLQASFPGLVAKYSLASIGYQKRDSKTAAVPARMVPAVLNYGAAHPELKRISYTVDCKAGGIITTTP